MTIRIVLADDQPVVLSGFRVMLDLADDLDVVGEASDGREAVDVVRRTGPDVVIMDVRMPNTTRWGSEVSAPSVGASCPSWRIPARDRAGR